MGALGILLFLLNCIFTFEEFISSLRLQVFLPFSPYVMDYIITFPISQLQKGDKTVKIYLNFPLYSKRRSAVTKIS